MSIIIGFVTQHCAVVASDGRIINGAYYENGILTRVSQVESDKFDKTFILNEGSIIGAVAGTMKFQEKLISGHLEEIIDQNFAGNMNSFDSISDSICYVMILFYWQRTKDII